MRNGLFGDDPITGREPCQRFSTQIHDDLYEASDFGVEIQFPPQRQREQLQEEVQVLRARRRWRGAVEAIGGAANLRRSRTWDSVSREAWGTEGGYEVGDL